jgi:hypothetical protein
MPHQTQSAPLVLVDCRPETEEVLRAIFEPRGVVVSREIQRRRPTSEPSIVIRGSASHYLATHAEVIDEPTAMGEAASAGNTCHELTLPPLFHYGELIRMVERLLQDRSAA